MRITNNYIFENSRRIMQNSINELLKAQEVMATQKKVNHLSEDPVAAGRILDTSTMVAQHEQFMRNIDTGLTYAELYDGAMETVVSLTERAKELVIAETNSASSTNQTREAARIEIVSLASQLVSVGNLQYSDRFLFAGYQDDRPPFLDIQVEAVPDAANPGNANVTLQEVNDPGLITGDEYEIVFSDANTYSITNITTGTPIVQDATYTSNERITFDGLAVRITDTDDGGPAAGDRFEISSIAAGQYQGDAGIVKYEIEQDVVTQVNLTGNKVFHGEGLPNGHNIFEVFENINVALRENDQESLNELLQDMDEVMEQVTGQQSIVGSKQNLFTKTSERLADAKMRLEILLSDYRDVEVSDAVIDLSKQEDAYQAVLNATGKILQPNLLEFVR